MALTQSFAVCRRPSTVGLCPAPFLSHAGVFLSGVLVRVDEKEARRAESPGLRPALGSSGLETVLLRKTACCPNLAGSSGKSLQELRLQC